MRRSTRNPAQRLRLAVESLPEATREAMLRGIESNRIIVGAYVDPRSGGVCPMLAAHRNGGRTSLASFARAWDCYTGAKRPRLATRRELRTLRALLISSTSGDPAATDAAPGSLSEAATRIRAERAEFAARDAAFTTAEPGVDGAPTRRAASGDRRPDGELRARLRWAWMRPARRYDEFKDLLAAAEGELAEHRAAELLGERDLEHSG